MITFEQLEALRVIVNAGTFSRAAEQLYLTQPALSQRIKHLEQALGIELFDRSRRGRKIELTPAGTAVLRFADHVSGEFDRLIRNLEYLQTDRRRETLSLVTGPNAARYILPRVLARYQKIHPNVRLNIIESPAVGNVINQMVLEGAAELGISIDPRHDQRLGSVFIQLYRVMLVAASEHPVSSTLYIDERTLLQLPFALFPSSASLMRQHMERQAQAVRTRLDVVVESNHFDVLKDAALRGQCLTVLPELVIHEELATGALTSIHALGMPYDLDVLVVYDVNRKLSPAAQAFLEFVRNECAQPVEAYEHPA